MGRAHPACDGRCRADLAAAAPRHLLDRRPQAAHLRPEARQPHSPRARQAREPVGDRSGRRRNREGPRRRHPGLRPRRRHRCEPAELAQARGNALGARPRRDPADAHAQRHARPGRGAGGRSAQDRPRRHHRRAARCRGVRLRDRAPCRLGLHHDARLPLGHVPRRRRDAEPRPARALRGQAGVRGQLHGVHRRRGARVPRRARIPVPRRGDRPPRGPRHQRGGRALEGERARSRRRSSPAPRSETTRPVGTRILRTTNSTSTSTSRSSRPRAT